MRRDIAERLVSSELNHALTKHTVPLASPHDGYAVLLEELDELWDDIKGHHPLRQRRMTKEAAQVAAMGLRFLIDLCEAPPEDEHAT